MTRSKKLDLLLTAWYIVFFLSMICCFRAISSISIALLLVTGLLTNKTDTGYWFSQRIKNLFLASCVLFFLLLVMGVFQNQDFNQWIKSAQLKSGLLFIPLAVCCCNFIDAGVRERLMKYYVWMLAAALFYCLLYAAYQYFLHNATADVFFYHELVSPFQQHAVQVSIYFFLALVYLLEKMKDGSSFYNRPVHYLLIVYCTGCLLLLSSKLVIVFSAACILYYFFLLAQTRLKNRLIVFGSLIISLCLVVLVLSTQNRISKRFNEILSGDLRLVERQDFSPGVYFNGLQFRLLQWRFVKEILSEQQAWLTGVGTHAQQLLDKKYISMHMYAGNPVTGTHGYLSYNTHNQFLEALLAFGIPGLLFFLLVCYAMIRLAILKKRRELSLVVILLIAYSFNESVFETQYGLALFIFFPLFLYYGLPSIDEKGVVLKTVLSETTQKKIVS